MKIAVALAVVIGSSAFAAPTAELQERTKKSAYPGGSYGAGPGYGAAASYGPPCAGAPVALYLAPQAAPHYREDDVPEENSEQARSSYGGYGAAGLAGSALSAGAGAIGYFPHSQIGGCGIPLLLSCSPKVIAGHLAKAHSYSVPSYKNPEDQEETTELKETMEKSWAGAERAANHHLDHHHHLISIDHLEHDHAHKALTA